jgi:hypothetical protein
MRPRQSATADLAELARTVRGALAERAGIRVGGVVFLRPGQVRRTTSGKIRRSHMRQMFMDGSLTGLYEDLDAPVLREYRATAHTACGRSA